jgi:hypothetical protein
VSSPTSFQSLGMTDVCTWVAIAGACVSGTIGALHTGLPGPQGGTYFVKPVAGSG